MATIEEPKDRLLVIAVQGRVGGIAALIEGESGKEYRLAATVGGETIRGPWVAGATGRRQNVFVAPSADGRAVTPGALTLEERPAGDEQATPATKALEVKGSLDVLTEIKADISELTEGSRTTLRAAMRESRRKDYLAGKADLDAEYADRLAFLGAQFADVATEREAGAGQPGGGR